MLGYRKLSSKEASIRFNKHRIDVKISKWLYFLSVLLAVLSVFFISRQFPLNLLGFDGIPKILIASVFLMTFFFFLKELYKQSLEVIVLVNIMFIISSIHVLYSLFQGNEPFYVVRFFLVSIFILMAYFITFKDTFAKVFIFINVIHSIFLFFFEIYLLFIASSNDIVEIRQFFLNNNLGDVYTFNGFFYRIQILGNPLLPVAFFLSLITNQKKIIKLILLIGIAIAANLAFYISTLIFLVLYYLQKAQNNKKLIERWLKISLLILIAIPFIALYLSYILPKKDESLNIRKDQFEVLINNISGNPISIFLGKGFGNTLNVETNVRNYTDKIYYELQTVYFFNQFGIFSFAYFFAILYLAFKMYRVQKEKFLAYVCYILYAVTNPYILDVTHVLVILSLNSAEKKYEKK